MTEMSEIENFSLQELFDPDNIIEIFELTPIERARYEALFLARASQLQCKKTFSDFYKRLKKEYCINEDELSATINTQLDIMRKDIKFAKARFNELSQLPMIESENGMREWEDCDDSEARRYIEAEYGLRNNQNYKDAINIFFRERTYHPVKDLIESVKWDGKDRIENILIKYLKCDDTPYTRELSRLIFAGGIHRIYQPGCKFDCVVVLMGKQGCGKSTFIRWLAMDDSFYSEIDTMEGKEGKELVRGVWICELGELLAVTKAKECEAVKAFITRQTDRYRTAYGMRTKSYERQCVFVGSTNKAEFLTDKTGNRRMFPIEVKTKLFELTDNEVEVKEEIKQCWAEALAKIDTDFMKPYENRHLIDAIREKQNDAMEEDWREGVIKKYLEDKSTVCVAELWESALNCDLQRLTRKDSNDIVLIMQNMDEWQRVSTIRTGKYGRQRGWKKIVSFTLLENDDIMPFK